MAESNSDLFHRSVECLLRNWAALQLAVQHGMGGPDSEAKGQWLIGAVQQYIEENNGLDVDEIEDFLEDFLNREMDTIADDGSLREISQKLFNYYKMYRENDHENLEKAIQRLPKFDSTRTKECTSFNEPTSQVVQPSVCDSMDQMQKGGDEAMDTESEAAPSSSSADEWQTVTRSRTKHRK